MSSAISPALTRTGRLSWVKTTAIAILCAFAGALEAAAKDDCRRQRFEGIPYIVCVADRGDDLRLFLNDEAGDPHEHFSSVVKSLQERGETLRFAMNAGMYHDDRSAVGLFIEDGDEQSRLNDNPGPGNFHMKPNGVFWVSRAGEAATPRSSRFHVSTTSAFKEIRTKTDVQHATQSGPMLVIDGDRHPRFLMDSTSFKIRNGVGVDKDGRAILVKSERAVRFYDFATFFRDGLGCDNALYLDGTISRAYAPSLNRNEPGAPMGPMIGVVSPAK